VAVTPKPQIATVVVSALLAKSLPAGKKDLPAFPWAGNFSSLMGRSWFK